MEQALQTQINNAVKHLRQGHIIAYPTEAIYGLGCDPYDLNAISELLQLKQRATRKGFILIISDWEQCEDFVEPLLPFQRAAVSSTWPGPVTWLFPAKREVPTYLKGDHTTIAIRMTAHPIARALCQAFGKAIISTSANFAGNEPVRDFQTVNTLFKDKIGYIINDKVGGQRNPTEIRDATTGETIRAA